MVSSTKPQEAKALTKSMLWPFVEKIFPQKNATVALTLLAKALNSSVLIKKKHSCGRVLIAW
jgi:hypothetical protein